MKLGRRREQDRQTEEAEREVNEDREGRGVEKEAVPSRRESLSSGRETVGSPSGSRLSLRSQLFLSTMSGEYLNNKGAVDVLLVAFAAL